LYSSQYPIKLSINLGIITLLVDVSNQQEHIPQLARYLAQVVLHQGNTTWQRP
jgi:hypothetical protein